MEYEFTCKCGCHNFMGPYKFDADNPIVVCPNCYKTTRCSNEFIRDINSKKKTD